VRNSAEEQQLIMGHYRKIMDNPAFRQSRLIFIPENNLGMEHHHLDTMVRAIDRVETFWANDKKPGIYKSASVTNEYQFLMNLTLQQKALRFEQSMFTCTREQTPASMRSMFEEQLLRYHWVVRKPTNEADPERRKLSGKMGSQQDDLLIAVAMVVYCGRLITRDPSRLDMKYNA